MQKRNPITLFDWKAFSLITCIMIIGVLTTYSATYGDGYMNSTPFYLKQMVWIILGIVILFLGTIIDYQSLAKHAYFLYFISIILLILVMFAGSKGFGAQRWLAIGGLRFQPSEIAKLTILLAIVRYFSDYPTKHGYTVRELLIPGGMIALPVLLILKQPDLGTALIITFVSISLIFLVRIRSRLFGSSMLLSVMLFPFVWQIFWDSLKEYQKTRLLTFINPGADPTGTGYHLLQSKIAIGSGGFLGKGLLESTQSHLNFLPARHTDFIFSVYAEEWGFLGVLALLTLYFTLIWWGIDVANRAKDRLGVLLATAITIMFTLYCVINIGMTLGLIPVVGLPLPLMSYGGTSIITTMFSLGVLFNIKARRYQFF